MRWIPLKSNSSNRGKPVYPFITVNNTGDIYISKMFVEEEALGDPRTANVYLDEENKRIGIVFEEETSKDYAYRLHYNNNNQPKTGGASGYMIACSGTLPLNQWGIQTGRYYEYHKENTEDRRNTIFIINIKVTNE